MGILSTMNSLLNENLINKASAALGEPASGVGTALRMAGPALLAGIMKKGASTGGMSELFAGIAAPSIDENITTQATKLLGNSTGLGQVLSSGNTLLSGIFGNKVDGVAGALSQVAGIKPAAARKMLAFAAPLLGGVMKSFIVKRNLNAGGLASALAQEGDSLMNAGLDPRLTSAMGIDDLRETVNSFSNAAAQHAEPAPIPRTEHAQPLVQRRSSWWPWAIGAAAAALGFVLITGLLDRNPEPSRVDGATVRVYFDTGQATIDDDDRRAIAAAAASAQASGGAVTLTPVTATDEASDQQLAVQRAAMIRDALVGAGVANERIVLRAAEVARFAEPVTEVQRVEIALAPSTENRSRN